ncbi:hypothetical protein LTR09_002790 [Extremus antarcticus]|uniref:Uncharacterized protein n=1 Tax=Extremus antarcticus TaxID=702011 RepID=A0AAJ0LUV9_9PEZI|nr:hypothetical protein LTR09_002790 [Extremus antarcticus]
MEAFPREYAEHELPLVLVSGLGESEGKVPAAVHPHLENGTRFQAHSPECIGGRPQSLLQQLMQLDGSTFPWNASSLPGPTGTLRYRVRAIGRSYTFPPRKAAPLPQSPSTEGVPPSNPSPSRTELHSPLSPLSPGSPIYPDGIFTPLWLAKHQYQVPSLFLAFFDFASDSPGADEQLKNDITATRAAISRSGFKSRFAAVLLSDKSILNAPQLEERLTSIRRLTNLDSKTGLFFMPPMSSQGEIATFVHSVMTTLQPLCVDYYRDLTKHARRKKPKAGSTVSSNSIAAGGAQSLSAIGWSLRYEVKQGVFAEIRQEMDVAERHYASAIDELFAADGSFETTAIISPRWNESRLLCDSLALRVIRCQLWSAQSTGAAQSWRNYKVRVGDLIARRGQGLQTYGWSAWESRWAEIMAQLVQRAKLQSLEISTGKASDETLEALYQIYAPPEKAFATTERLPPFYSLHHAGYWLRLAVRTARMQWRMALAIPDEDLIASDQLPASAVASRDAKYDLYLVEDPHKGSERAKRAANLSEQSDSHLSVMWSLTQKSNEQYLERSQARMSDALELELAHDLIDAQQYEEAYHMLHSMWEESTWRNEDWHELFANLLQALHHCARHIGDREMIVATAYELVSTTAAVTSDVPVDLHTCLDGQQPDNTAAAEPLNLEMHDGQRLCPVSLSFAFANKETHVGEALECQLTVQSHANPACSPIPLSSLALQIGPSKRIVIKHSADHIESSQTFVTLDALAEAGNDTTEIGTSLSLESGQERTYSFQLSFREAATHQVRQASITIDTSAFSIKHIFSEPLVTADHLYVKADNGALERALAPYADVTSVKVLPKPPKVKMHVLRTAREYYTDETIRIGLELRNEEIEAVGGSISAAFPGESEESLPLQWLDEKSDGTTGDNFQDPRETQVVHNIDQIPVAGTFKVVLFAKAPAYALSTEVLIELQYTLASEKQTTLKKTLTAIVNIVLPFEVKFSFGPLLHQDPWPSYFNPGAEGEDDQATGISQSWRLSSQISSLASSDLILHEVQPVIDTVFGESRADVVDVKPIDVLTFGPGQSEPFTFEIGTQKQSLDDRRPTSLESTLAVTWSRKDDEDNKVTTYVPVPRLTLPVSEPRVLCTIVDAQPEHEYDATLQYHIENPSTHFLTFAVTMEATEYFAFSGPKYRTLSLAPLSRYRVAYRISLQEHEDDQSARKPKDDNGRWIWPAFQVIDSYYQKTLRVHPGGSGVRFDEKQNISVFVKQS